MMDDDHGRECDVVANLVGNHYLGKLYRVSIR